MELVRLVVEEQAREHDGAGQEQRGRHRDQQAVVEALAPGVLEDVEDNHAADGGGNGPDGDPARQLHVYGAVAQVAPAPDRLRDRAVGEVCADCGDGLVAEEQDQDRRHQRAAADPGRPNQDPDPEPE